MENTLTVRITNNFLLRDKNFKVYLNGEQKTVINTKNNIAEILIEEPINLLEIKSRKAHKSIGIDLHKDKSKTLFIRPSMTYEIALIVLIAMAIFAALSIIFLSEEIQYPLLFIGFIPLFFLKKKYFDDTFEIYFK